MELEVTKPEAVQVLLESHCRKTGIDKIASKSGTITLCYELLGQEILRLAGLDDQEFEREWKDREAVAPRSS